MIIIPEGARRLLESYIRVFDQKAKNETNESYKIFYKDIAKNMYKLQNDLRRQKSRIFQGSETEVMINFVSFLDQFDEFMTYEERCKYFSSVRINPNDLERLIIFGTKDSLRILNYLFDSAKLWTDGFDETDGFNREFRLVESKNQIPDSARKLPSSVFDSWELYYDTVCIRRQIPDDAWNNSLSFVEKDMLDIYKKWNGLYNLALYYVLVK